MSKIKAFSCGLASGPPHAHPTLSCCLALPACIPSARMRLLRPHRASHASSPGLSSGISSALRTGLVPGPCFSFLFNPSISTFKHFVPSDLMKMPQICDFSRLQSHNSPCLSVSKDWAFPLGAQHGLQHSLSLSKAFGTAFPFTFFLHPLPPLFPRKSSEIVEPLVLSLSFLISVYLTLLLWTGSLGHFLHRIRCDNCAGECIISTKIILVYYTQRCCKMHIEKSPCPSCSCHD